MSLLSKTKIGASDLIFAIRSPGDPSKPEANTQQEEALGKPDCVCGARIQTKICKTQIPARQWTRHLLVTHLLTDVLNCKGIFLSKLLICLPSHWKTAGETLSAALCESLHLTQSCRTERFHRSTIFPSHLSIAEEESSVLRARGSCLITWQEFAQTLFSVRTGFQSLKLCFEFCIQKSKTSEPPQSKGAD